jgi:hypothetical protein
VISAENPYGCILVFLDGIHAIIIIIHVICSVQLIKHYAMKTSALVGGEWSTSSSGRFVFRERASRTDNMEDCMGPRVRLNDMKKLKFSTLLGLEHRTFSHLARSQSLYRLSYFDYK